MKIVSKSLVVLGLVSMLFAVEPTMNMGGNSSMPGDVQQKRIMENGGLSMEQHTKIKEIHDKYRTENKDISDKLAETRKTLMTEMEATPRSNANITKLKEDMAVLQEKLKDNRENLKKETDSVYTPEQMTKRNQRIAEQAEKAKKAKEAREAKEATPAQ